MDEQTPEPVTETGDTPVQEKAATPTEEVKEETENVAVENSTPLPSAGEVTEETENAGNETPAENKEVADEETKEEQIEKEGEEKVESADTEEVEKKDEDTEEGGGEKEEGVGEEKKEGEEQKEEEEVPPQSPGDALESVKEEGESPEGEDSIVPVTATELEESVEVVEQIGLDEDAQTPNIGEEVIMEDEVEEELLMEEELPQYNREELIQKYQASVTEREQLKQQNYALQHKLAEYFRKKKTEESRQEVDKNVSDQEQRYFKYMLNLEELRLQLAADQEAYNEQLEEFKERKMEKQSRVEEEWKNAIEYKKAVAMAAINSRSGRPILPKDVELYETNERKKESEVSQVRLENIKLKNRLKKQENQLKQKEELAEGLHLIDFEQLKIENQTYNEKIEERNEELLKLRKKITNTVQVLTHLKEKLQFVQGENQVKKQHLSSVEQHVAQKRDILSRTKQVRDALRHDNAKLLQKSGLLGNTDLLRDFEIGTDEASDLQYRLEQLKRNHAELTLSLNGVKKKIELTKENQT